MAKPRVFISSTFYDLKQIRVDLDNFIMSLGYDVVRNEEGEIPYGTNSKLEDYCYKEISTVDIVVAIIGGRFGTASDVNQKYSISNEEIKTAIEHNKQVYVFIDRDVNAEFQTYLKNKEKDIDIEYSHVDDKRIFQFIEEIKGLKRNNIIHPFYSSGEIISFLREQWAGLLQHYLQEQAKFSETDTLRDLKETLGLAKNLTELLVSANEDQNKNISEIVFASHPVFTELRKAMGWKYPIIFHNLTELRFMLEPWGYVYPRKTVKEHYFTFANSRAGWDILVHQVIFDKDGKLLSAFPPMSDALVLKEKHVDIADDLPF